MVRSSLILQMLRACLCLFTCKQSDNNLFFFFSCLSARAGLNHRRSLGFGERGLISRTAAGNRAYARMGGIFRSSISPNPDRFVKRPGPCCLATTTTKMLFTGLGPCVLGKTLPLCVFPNTALPPVYNICMAVANGTEGLAFLL